MHPGGHQPKEFEIKKTARELGLTKEEVRRSKAIAGILPTAKAKLRKLGLDDNQRALLEIAQASTPKAQLRAVKNIVERKRAARDRNAATAITDKKTAAAIENLEADIREKEDALDSLKSDWLPAQATARVERLAVQDEVAVLHRTRSSAAADNQSGSEARSELTHGVAGKELPARRRRRLVTKTFRPFWVAALCRRTINARSTPPWPSGRRARTGCLDRYFSGCSRTVHRRASSRHRVCPRALELKLWWRCQKRKF